ncbi:MAG: hypothetical protein A2086_10340 [Spirochaetes bacterium GWD1_27_9]|nr:MAG: hypothetical protein A2Z98_14280 [Spirochaetes bacterium GWB1_27_13]OHD27715.1 MAG: hypothetical protein A2Y34_08780 [Spirochaetes bacterium GWC1_27_15]OHD43676.1 MAG: hypothetical protein A2086_10340 [Spirochaetes bacterium GWD1_27_9]
MKKRIFCGFILIFNIFFIYSQEIIKIDPSNYDFGTVKKGEIVRGKFVLSNLINQQIDITIQSSCECLEIDENYLLLKPKEDKTIFYQLETEDYDGYIEKEIIINVKSDKNLLFFVKISGNVGVKNQNQTEVQYKNIQNNNFDIDNIEKEKSIIVFSYKNCRSCIKIIKKLEELANNTNSNVKIFYIEENDNKKNIYEISKKIGFFPELPIIIKDGKYYFGKNAVKDLINGNKPKKETKAKFRTLNTITVILSGLLDGINPCAFTVIILLLSYLSLQLKNAKKILISGLFYIIAVFITYFLVGIGIFEFIRRLQTFNIISTIFKYILTFFLFGLSIITLFDFIKSLQGKSNQMFLKLPDFLQKSIRQNIREQMKDYKILFGSFLLGFIISLFELVCTGQVYLPIIGYIIRSSDQFLNGIFFLIIYNIAFILPLTVVFILVYCGISSKEIGDFFGKNIPLIKFMFFLLFILFAVLNIVL